LTGFVDDVRAPVARSTLCVAPIRQGSGTRLKILEAMALGTPVVSTTKGTEGLEVADGAHFVCADSPAEFAHATLSLLADAGRRAHLATNARRLVETHYDWGRIGNQFVALVEDLSLPH
jgi:glycosyltransferase involved in cell wall biosynthesis